MLWLNAIRSQAFSVFSLGDLYQLVITYEVPKAWFFKRRKFRYLGSFTKFPELALYRHTLQNIGVLQAKTDAEITEAPNSASSINSSDPENTEASNEVNHGGP